MIAYQHYLLTVFLLHLPRNCSHDLRADSDAGSQIRSPKKEQSLQVTDFTKVVGFRVLGSGPMGI